MASWLKCTAKRDGAAVYVNLENAVSVYWSERDKGTIIAFVGGEKDAVIVQKSLNRCSRGVERFRAHVPQLAFFARARPTKGFAEVEPTHTASMRRILKIRSQSECFDARLSFSGASDADVAEVPAPESLFQMFRDGPGSV